MPDNVNQLALVPLEKLARDISMPTADMAKLVKIYNSMRPAGENKIRMQTISNEPYVTQGEIGKLQNFFETKIFDLNKFADQLKTYVPVGDIKHMCDKCTDDRISSLLPDTAKIRPFTLNGQYYLSINYIDMFEDRIKQFNEILPIAEERANEIDKEIEAELELAEHNRMMEQNENETDDAKEQPNEFEEDANETFDDYDEDAELKEEKRKKRKELQKKKELEFRKEIERKGVEEYKRSSELKRIEELKRADAARELIKKQEYDATEFLKREEENARRYKEHADKVRNAIGDKYETNETNILEELRKNQEKYRKEQEEKYRLDEELRKSQEEYRKAQENVLKANEEAQKRNEELKRAEEIQKNANAIKNEEDRKRLADENKRLEENARKANEEAQRKNNELQKQEQALNNTKYSDEERKRAEENVRRLQEENRILQEKARKANEEFRRNEEIRKTAEMMRTEEGRKKIEEENRRRQEQNKISQENVRKANEEAQRREQERKARETAQYEYTVKSTNTIDNAIKTASSANAYAKSITEEYNNAKSSLDASRAEVIKHTEELRKIDKEMENARLSKNIEREKMLAELSRKTQENLTQAVNASELYAVKVDTLKTVQSDAVLAATSAQAVFDKSRDIEDAERKRAENTKKLEEYQKLNSSYGTNAVPPKSAPPEVLDRYNKIKELESANARLDKYINSKQTELASSIKQMNYDSGMLKNTYDAMSDLSHKTQIETIAKQTERTAEYNILKEKAYVTVNYDIPTYTKPIQNTLYTPSTAKLDPIPILDDKIRNARMNGTGRDVGYSPVSTPETLSGGSFNVGKASTDALKNAAFGSMSQSTLIAPPSERTTGVIDYGNYSVTYEFNKSDAVAFQKFSETVTANRMSAAEVGRTISSTSQPADQRFRPTTLTNKSGEVTNIDKSALKDDSIKALQGRRSTIGDTNISQPTPVEQIRNENRLHTKIDVGSIVNTATASTARFVGRSLGRTEPFYGLTKTYRAAKSTAEITSAIFMTEGVRNQMATANVTNFMKTGKTSSQATYFMTQRYRNQMDVAKLNSRIEAYNLSNKNANIKLVDETFGLGVQKGVPGSYSGNLASLLKREKIADLSKLSDKDFDRLINLNPGLKKELLAQKKVTQLLQGKANSVQGLTKAELKGGIKGDASKLTDAQIASVLDGIKDKDLRKALIQRTGIKGFNSKLDDKISTRGDRTRKLGYNKAMMDIENSAAELASGLLKGKYSAEQLKKMSVHDLEALLKSLPNTEDMEGVKEALKAMIGVKQMAAKFIETMKKNGIKGMWDSYRRAAQNNESMAGYYEIKQIIMSARTAKLNTYKIGKWVFKKLNLQDKLIGKMVLGARKGIQTIKQAPKKIAKKALKGIDNKLFKGKLQNSKLNVARKKLKSVTKDKIKQKAKGLAKKGLKKLLGPKLSSALNGLRKKIFAKIGEILAKLLKVLMPIIKWLIIGIAIIIAAILATSFLMYAVGTVGGMITSFWENLWAENIMDSQAGKTLNNLISYDEYYYVEIDKISERAESLMSSGDKEKMKFMQSVGLENSYGFYDPTYGKGITEDSGIFFVGTKTLRYHIRLPGMPYGKSGYEQYYYDATGNNIARYSNSKDILTVGYAAFDGEVNVLNKLLDNESWGNPSVSYTAYSRELWEKTHLCTECNQKFGLVDEWDAKFYGVALKIFGAKTYFGTEISTIMDEGYFPTYGIPIPILKVTGITPKTIHCHSTDVYACVNGDCDNNGSVNTFTYYCNKNPKDVNNDQTETQRNVTYAVYDVKVWKGESLKTKPTDNTSVSSNDVYMCVIDGDLSDGVSSSTTLYPAGQGCKTVYCQETGDITKCTTYSDGHTKDYWGNYIGYYQYKGNNASGDYKKCWNQSTASGHTIKQVDNGLCSHNFFVAHTASELNNGSCGKSNDTCYKYYCGSTLYDNAYDRNGSYSHASTYQSPYCTNYKTVSRYVRCDGETYEEKTYTGTFYRYNDDGTYTAETGYKQKLGYWQYTCSHRKLRETVTNYEDLYYTNGSDNFEDWTYAGYIEVQVPVYDCTGEKQTLYICKGECSGYYVCGGHTECKGHKFCDGHQMSYCTGHTDVYTTIRIVGINDNIANNATYSIFTLGNFGAGSGRMQKSEVIDLAKSTYNGDWEDLYNISFQRSNTVMIQLSDAEKFTLQGSLNRDNGDHTVIVDWALTSVARIPYYNGDCDMNSLEPLDNSDDYKEFFTSLVKDVNDEVIADPKGRVLKGLNDEKFVQYMYYTAGHITQAQYQASYSSFLSNFDTVADNSNIRAGDIVKMTVTDENDGSTIERTAIVIKPIDAAKNKYLIVECSDSAGTVIYGQQILKVGTTTQTIGDKTFTIKSTIHTYKGSNCICKVDES